MKIELVIGGEKKTFTTPFVPLLARRKYYEILAKEEEESSGGALTAQQVIDNDDAMYSILTDIVFDKQFSIEDLMKGASKQYVDEKLTEAIFGRKPKEEKNEGNSQGE